MVTQLDRAFQQWSASGDPLVLATVYETEGSTYSKAGARMLITADGIFQGMLSGGCLEGDLALRAKQVATTGVPQSVTYDLGQNDEELWGMGVGCDGLMRIFLQPISSASDYEPFTSMQKAQAGTAIHAAAIVIDSNIEDLPSGSSMLAGTGAVYWSDIPGEFQKELLPGIATAIGRKASTMVVVGNGSERANVLIAVLHPTPRVLVLGAGLDAEPVVRLIAELGWRVTISDHRPAYIESGDFSLAERILCVEANAISTEVELSSFDAVVVMSHHLVTDETYLRQIAGSDIAYVGLLGPPNRKQRLLATLGDDAAGLVGRLYGPAGIDINASGPASIALSIVAQLHQVLLRQGQAGLG